MWCVEILLGIPLLFSHFQRNTIALEWNQKLLQISIHQRERKIRLRHFPFSMLAPHHYSFPSLPVDSYGAWWYGGIGDGVTGEVVMMIFRPGIWIMGWMIKRHQAGLRGIKSKWKRKLVEKWNRRNWMQSGFVGKKKLKLSSYFTISFVVRSPQFQQ